MHRPARPIIGTGASSSASRVRRRPRRKGATVNTRKLSHADLRVGMLIPWNVYGENGGLLMRKGQPVASAQQLASLVERGYCEDPCVATGPAEQPQSVLRKLGAARHQLQRVLEAVATGSASAPVRAALEQVAVLVGAAVLLNAEVAVASILHHQHEGRYALRHSINSAIVAQVLAHAIGLPLAELDVMTLAALTMNVGMLARHEQLQHYRGGLSESEQDYIRGHPERSVALLRQAGVDDEAWLACVAQHHENKDGSGYPAGLGGEHICRAARLLGLAERYCARVSERGYRKTMLPNAALRDILLEAGQQHDKTLSAALIRALGVYQPGTCVRLLNGEIGIVARKGSSPAAPQVAALIGPRGAPLAALQQRDTGSQLHGIREVLFPRQAGLQVRMEQIWGRVASR